MTVEAHLAAVRRLLDEGWNQGKLEVVDELVAEDAVPAHESTSPGRQSWKDAIVMDRSAFPDLTYSIDDLFGTGDKVVLRWTATATDTLGFMGRPPTGRRATPNAVMPPPRTASSGPAWNSAAQHAERRRRAVGKVEHARGPGRGARAWCRAAGHEDY